MSTPASQTFCASRLPELVEAQVRLTDYQVQDELPEVLFIIGVPRSGSTILFECLTEEFLVLYPDNLVELFGFKIALGFHVSELIFRHRAHNCFNSFHGRTHPWGLRGPNELERFFRSILPSAEADAGERLSGPARPLMHLRRELSRVKCTTNISNCCVIFKNLQVSQYITEVREVLPRAKFVLIQRDPLLTAQSIIIAQRIEGRPLDEFWYLRPRRFPSNSCLNPLEQAVVQVNALEKEIAEQLGVLPASNFRIVSYKQLCCSTEEIVHELGEFIMPGGLPRRLGRAKPVIKYSCVPKLPAEEVAYLSRLIGQLSWPQY